MFFVLVCCAGELRAQPRLDKTGWSLIFFDDFNTTPVGNPDWYTTFAHSNPNGQDWHSGNYFRNDLVTVVSKPNGPYMYKDLHLGNRKLPSIVAEPRDPQINPITGQIIYDPVTGLPVGKPYYWETGMVRSSYDDKWNSNMVDANGNVSGPIVGQSFTEYNKKGGYLYGMFEIRCKVQSHRAGGNAFWLVGNNAAPMEIDVFEMLHPYEGYDANDPNTVLSDPANVRFNGIFSSVHKDYNVPVSTSCAHHFYFPESLSNEFHTYTMVWTPFEIAFFFDGVEMKTHTDPSMMMSPDISMMSTDNQGIYFDWAAWNLIWQSKDIIINGGTNGHEGWGATTDWNICNNLGITDLSDFVIDYAAVYRPTGLTLPNTSGPLARKPMPYSTTGIGGFRNFYINTMRQYYNPSHANYAKFRTSNDWKLDYLAWDINELVNANQEGDYKAGAEICNVEADPQRWFHVSPYYIQRTPGQPNARVDAPCINTTYGNRHDSYPVATGYANPKNLAPLKYANGSYALFFSNNGQLYKSTHTTGVGTGWSTAAVAGVTNVNSDLQCRMEGNLEVLIYRSTANKLIKRTTNLGVVPNTVTTQDLTTLSGGASNVMGNLMFDPVNDNTYYYKNAAGSSVGKLARIRLEGSAWKYLLTTQNLNRAVTTARGDASWRKLWLNSGGNMYIYDLATMTSSNLVGARDDYPAAGRNQSLATNVVDFCAGKNPYANTNNTLPKSVYLMEAGNAGLSVVSWMPAVGSTPGYYQLKRLPFLGVMGQYYSLSNSSGSNQDKISFVHPADGIIRTLEYGAVQPVLTNPAFPGSATINGCKPGWNSTDANGNQVFNHAPFIYLQSNPNQDLPQALETDGTNR